MKKPGRRFETCVGCGLEWNVSLTAPAGWYVCPHCEYKARKERHGAKNDHHNGKKTGAGGTRKNEG